jgi:hypothetical protein
MNGIVPTEKHISLQSELIIRNSCGALKALPAT